MIKANIKLLSLSFLFAIIALSCDHDTNPKAIVRVTEYVDSVLVPVDHILVQIGPPTEEKVLDDVLDQGYSDSQGYVNFEFEKELILRAVAIRYEEDGQGNPILDDKGNPIIIKSGYKTVVFKKNNTDSRVIEIR